MKVTRIRIIDFLKEGNIGCTDCKDVPTVNLLFLRSCIQMCTPCAERFVNKIQNTITEIKNASQI